jgi:hypothetical protein
VCINHTKTPLFCTQATRVANNLITTANSCDHDSGAVVPQYGETGKNRMNRNIGSIGPGIDSRPGSASISTCPKSSLDECVRLPFRPSPALAVGDYTTCRRCCTLRLLPWIRSLTTSPEASLALHAFARFDIVLKAAVARSWLGTDGPGLGTDGPGDATPFLHLPQWWEEAYLSYLTSRIGRNVKYNMSIRLDMFRGLVNSVRARGFQWGANPIKVDYDFQLIDGSHRVACVYELPTCTSLSLHFEPNGAGTSTTRLMCLQVSLGAQRESCDRVTRMLSYGGTTGDAPSRASASIAGPQIRSHCLERDAGGGAGSRCTRVAPLSANTTQDVLARAYLGLCQAFVGTY